MHTYLNERLNLFYITAGIEQESSRDRVDYTFYGQKYVLSNFSVKLQAACFFETAREKEFLMKGQQFIMAITNDNRKKNLSCVSKFPPHQI